ncbi:hypothetical protein E1A91_A03G161700v1 [Gossypium mustelinum]|uniref:Homeobox-leucine zipper protein n=1 Tax=Gossypium mustelinum TaxID=34275 RepID=A0A5D2ZZ69_GOSMU|nr:hypothetical protein E1A91_A03G161700v1 [Gossypium mustelinum]
MEPLWTPSSSSSALQGEKPVMEYEYVNGGDDDLDGSCQPAGVKKRRLSTTQVEFLERSFEVENKLESDRKLRLAKELGLQPRQVAIWFQNRRARSKNKQLEKDYDSLRATFDKLKADFDNLLKEKDDLKNQVLTLKEKLLSKETGMENLGSVEAIHSSNDEPQKPNPDASHVPLLACKQEEACSAKSDVFDSDSPHYPDGHGYHSSFIEPADSSNVFEPDQSDEEDDLSKSLLHPPLFFPKFDCYYDAPATSCNFSLPVEDQSFWSSLY